MILRILIIILIFILPVYSQESENIQVNIDSKINLKINSYTRHYIDKPELVKIKINKDSLEIEGVRSGNTILYVWENDNLKTFLITVKNNYTNTLKDYTIIKPKDYNYKKKKDNDISASISTRYYSNSYKDRNISNINSLIKFEFPFKFIDEGKFLFNSNINFIPYNSSNINSTENYFFNVLNLNYREKNINFMLGDISSTNSFSQLENQFISDDGGIKGLAFDININDKLKLNTYNGFRRGISQFDNIFYLKDSYLLSAGALYKFNELFNIKTSFINSSKNELNEKNTNAIGIGIDYQPLKNLNFSLEGLTNFDKFGLASDLKYYYYENKNYFRANFLNSFFDKDFYHFTNRPIRNNNLNISTNLLYDTKINFRYNGYTNKFFDNNTFSLSIKKEIYDFLNPEVNFQYSLLGDNTVKRYGLSNSISYYPIDFNINAYLNDYSENYSSSLLLSAYLFKKEFFNIKLSEDLNFNSLSTVSRTGIGTNINWDKLIAGINFSYSTSTDTRVTGAFSVSPSIKYSYNNHYLKLIGNISYFKDDYRNNLNLQYEYKFKGIEQFFDYSELIGFVFIDENEDGILNENEKKLESIKVILGDKIINTNEKGFIFSDLKPGPYILKIDPKTIPTDYNPLYNENKLAIYGKGNIFNIPISNKINATAFVKTPLSTGIKDIIFTLDENNDLFYSDNMGVIRMRAEKGKHKIKINYESIPVGYLLLSLSEQIIDTNNEDEKIEFILKPITSIELTVFYKKTKKFIKDIPVKVIFYKDENEIEKEYITDENGKIYLSDLSAGKIKIESDYFEPIFQDLGDYPQDINLNIEANIKEEKFNLNNKKRKSSVVKKDNKKEDKTFIYTVKKGDTWISISKKYYNDTKFIDILIKLNKKKNLIIDDSIQIPYYKYLKEF